MSDIMRIIIELSAYIKALENQVQQLQAQLVKQETPKE